MTLLDRARQEAERLREYGATELVVASHPDRLHLHYRNPAGRPMVATLVHCGEGGVRVWHQQASVRRSDTTFRVIRRPRYQLARVDGELRMVRLIA